MNTRTFPLVVALLLAPAVAGAQTAQNVKPAKSNLTTKEWITDIATNNRFLDHCTTYDADGHKIEELEYNDRGLLWRKRFEYGPNGKIFRELTYDFRGRLDNIRKYEYNELDRRKIEYVYNAKGKLIRTKTYEYIVSK